MKDDVCYLMHLPDAFVSERTASQHHLHLMRMRAINAVRSGKNPFAANQGAAAELTLQRVASAGWFRTIYKRGHPGLHIHWFATDKIGGHASRLAIWQYAVWFCRDDGAQKAR